MRTETTGNPVAVPPLVNDADHFTRLWAIEALGVWGTKDAVPSLLKAMKDKESRGDAMKALGRLKDERAAEPIAERLEEFFDQHEAAEALKQMGPVAEKAVLARLNHHDLHVRITACDILAVIGTQKSIPPLEKVVAAGKDPFAGEAHLVAMKAEQAIKSIRSRQ
jgi:HEAT repeat protein